MKNRIAVDFHIPFPLKNQISLVKPELKWLNMFRLFSASSARAVCTGGMLVFIFLSTHVSAQTDFAPGEIMFTGYDSDAPNAFSIVLLKDAVAGTVIYITDRGWNSASGFRNDANGEGTISFTLTYDYTCGTSFVFTDIGGANDWQVTDAYGVVVGTVAIIAGGDTDGIELGTTGDQLFIYQLPEPTLGNQGSFVCMIQMDNDLTVPVNTDDESQIPTGLAANTVVRFNTEVDNAKYDCSPVTGSATTLQTAITNDNGSGGLIADGSNNWAESNTYISLFPVCSFCCGSTPPVIAPVITAPCEATYNETITINITGTLGGGQVWELYTDGCGIGTPIQTTTSSSFIVTAPDSQVTLTYYVRSSEEVDCGGICDFVEIPVGWNTGICTDCFANPNICGVCFLPEPANNPDLDSGCFEQKLIFILDESGSIGGDEINVRNGVLAFLNALNGQDILVALIEFSDLARVVNDYTIVNDAYILAVQNYFDLTPCPVANGSCYQPNGGTNWHDAMIKADGLAVSNMIMFFTDGEPTAWANNGAVDYCGNGSTTQTPEIVNPVNLANKLKLEGTHMFMLGVGNNIVETNLEYMSGFTEYVEGVNTIGSSDYSIGNFADLAEDLGNFVEELCNTNLVLDKQLFGAVCNNVQQFRFILHNTGTQSAATLIETDDEFPSGYTNITYNIIPGHPQKVKINDQCLDFPDVGDPAHLNGFRWVVNSIPPGGYDTLLISATVLGVGVYDNYATALGNNTNLATDSIINPVFVVDDIPPTIACPPNVSINCSESTLPAHTGIAIASDPDGSTPEVTYVDVITPGPCAEQYSIERTWTATDGCTNSIGCPQTITVDDVPPVINTCAVTRNIEGCGTASITGPAYSATSATSSEVVFENATNQGAASDLCGISTVTYIDVASGTCPVTVTRTWTIGDPCENTVTCAQTIIIDDNVVPAVTGSLTPIAIEGCSAASAPPATTVAALEAFPGNLLITDNCAPDANLVVTSTQTTNNTCPIVITRTYKVTDPCLNTSVDIIHTLNVDDNLAPAVSGSLTAANVEGCSVANAPAAVTTVAALQALPGGVQITDACTEDGNLTVTSTQTSTGTCPTVITRTYKVTDVCLNTSVDIIHTINVDDNLAPAVTGSLNVTNIEGCAVGAAPAAVTTVAALEALPGSLQITDACTTDGNLVVTNTQTSTGTCPIVITRTYKVTDLCLNTSVNIIHTINVDDNIAPAVTGSITPTTVEGCAVGAAPAAVTTVAALEALTGNLQITDGCTVDGSLVVTNTQTSAGTCPIVVTRTYKVTDACLNTSVNIIHTINITDTTPPSVTGSLTPTNVEGCTVANAPAAVTTVAALEALAGGILIGDNCAIDANLVVTSTQTNTGTCPIVITRTYKVTDPCLNTSVNIIHTINVDDNTAPAVTGSITPTTVEGCAVAAAPAPVTTVAALEALTGSPQITDACTVDGSMVVTSTQTSTGTCPIVITRTYKVTDVCLNTSVDIIHTINVDDNTAPGVTGSLTPTNVEGCTVGAAPAAVTTVAALEGLAGNLQISDACTVDGSLVVTNTQTSTGTCPIVITRTYKVTDVCLNTSVNIIHTINVDDNTAPVATGSITPITVEGCTVGAAPAAVTTVAALEGLAGNLQISDGCTVDGSLVVTSTQTSAGTCPIVITRRYKVTDACINTSVDIIHTINVDDTVAPAVTGSLTATSIEGCTVADAPAAVTTVAALEALTGNLQIADGCTLDGSLTVSSTQTSTGSCPIVITRTYKVTDACLNTSVDITHTINVDDNLAPVVSGSLTQTTVEGCTVGAAPAAVTTVAALEALTGNLQITDACITDANLVVTNAQTSAGTCPIVITRTYKVTDICINTSVDIIHTINVDDTTSPVLGVPANITIECTDDTLPATTGIETVSDNCDATPLTTFSDITTSSSCPQEYTITRTWTATDVCGNSSLGTQLITIDDSTPPILTCPANVTIECIDDTTPTNTGLGTSTDNCDGSPGMTHSDVTMATPPTHGYLINRTWSTSDACGNVSTCVQVITVTNPLEPALLPYDTLCSGDFVAIESDNPGINPLFFDWSFGSGSNPSTATGIGEHNIQYTYNGSNGTVGAWVILTLSTPGCETVADTVSNIHVNPIPNATIIASDGTPCVLDPKTFQPQAPEMPGFTYTWNFGAGANIPDAVGYGPHTIEYLTAGPKTVQLIVFSNEEGASCGDTATFMFTVNLCPGNITGKVLKSDGTPIPSVNVRLYVDQDLDGMQDITIIIRSVFTNSVGSYAMATITPGYYVIVETQPANYFSLYDEDATEDYDSLSNLIPNDNIIPVTVEPSEIDSNNNFIEISSPSIISGYVFEDFDNNQAPANIEGIQGVTVQLHTDNDQNGVADPAGLVGTTTTNGQGFYTFGGYAIGNYVLVELQPAGYNNIQDIDPSNDNDMVPNTNMTDDIIPVTLTNAENDANNYFKEFSICSKIVTTVLDNVPGSLRYMIDCAGNGDTIIFHPALVNQTLHLNAGRIEFNKDLHILSSINPPLMIQADVSGAFKILSGITAEFKNLYITSGLSGFPGAAFDNYGQLILWDVFVFRNALLPSTDYLIFNGIPGLFTAKGNVQIQTE